MCKSDPTLWVILLILLAFVANSSAQYSDGSGTEQDPYQIQTASDWLTLLNTSADWNKNFILTADLDLQGITLTPVGNSSIFFTGFLDGDNHVIRNAVINMPDTDSVGLFGYVGETGRISNLGVEDSAAAGRNNVGTLAGFNGGSLTDCYADTDVSGEQNVGGLVGTSSGSLVDCYATGAIVGIVSAGGLLGYNSYGNLSGCHSTADVRSSLLGGGLVGVNDGDLTACRAGGDVTGSGPVIGGLVGSNGGYVTACYSTGHITGDGGVGGLVGWNSYYGTITACFTTSQVSGNTEIGGLVGLTRPFGVITNSYATGDVNGSVEIVGGLVGRNDGATIANCYAAGRINGGAESVGGLVGQYTPYDTDVLIACFWNTDLNPGLTGLGDGSNPNLIGETTQNMQTQSTFTGVGWDFIAETANGTDDMWKILRDGQDYPRLSWQDEYRADIAGLYGTDLVDFAVFAASWLSDDVPTGNWNPVCDISSPPDGVIDESDFVVFAEGWLAGR